MNEAGFLEFLKYLIDLGIASPYRPFIEISLTIFIVIFLLSQTIKVINSTPSFKISFQWITNKITQSVLSLKATTKDSFTSPYANKSPRVDRVSNYISMTCDYIFSLFFFMYFVMMLALLIFGGAKEPTLSQYAMAIAFTLFTVIMMEFYKVSGNKKLYKLRH